MSKDWWDDSPLHPANRDDDNRDNHLYCDICHERFEECDIQDEICDDCFDKQEVLANL
jgi:hypothetical protein